MNTDTKICIICPEHGEFWQSPSNHLQGQGCKQCSLERRKKKMIEIINNLLLCLELEGDGGCTSFTAK